MAFSEIGTAARLLRAILDRQGAAGERGAPASRPPAPPAPPPATRSGRIERILADLCATPGARGAVVADDGGLLLASHGGPFPADRWAALSTLLGSAADGMGRLLGPEAGAGLALRIGESEEALLARLAVGPRAYRLVLLRSARSPGRPDLSGAAAALAAELSGAPEEP